MDENTVIQTPQSSGGEDFGWYLKHAPDAMTRLGCWSDHEDKYDLYRDNLIVGEYCLDVSAKLLVGIVAHYEDGAQSTITVR